MFERIKLALERLRAEARAIRLRRRREPDAEDYYHFDQRRARGAAGGAPVPGPESEVENTGISAAPGQRAARASSRPGLSAKLREPGSLRDAIVLNEILRKPLALRRRR